MQMLSSTGPDLINLGVGDASVIALLGYSVVFFGIVLLMAVVMIMGKAFVAAENKKKTAIPAPAAAVPAPDATDAPKATAPGAAGQLKLHDVEPKTAAMLMAIVAHKLNKPLNELRFISIKEVK